MTKQGLEASTKILFLKSLSKDIKSRVYVKCLTDSYNMVTSLQNQSCFATKGTAHKTKLYVQFLS